VAQVVFGALWCPARVVVISPASEGFLRAHMLRSLVLGCSRGADDESGVLGNRGSDRLVKTGLLLKRSVSSKFMPNWRRRVITLSRTKITWRTQGASNILGELHLGMDTRLSRCSCGRTQTPGFVVSTLHKELRIACSSEEECAEWMRVIKEETIYSNVLKRRISMQGCGLQRSWRIILNGL